MDPRKAGENELMETKIALVSVYGAEPIVREMFYRKLYELLLERKPYMNISHNGRAPTWENHVKFVDSKPYKDWFLIQDIYKHEIVGSIYLGKENNVGVFIFEKCLHKGYGTLALDILMERFSDVPEIEANIAPTNSTSLCFFLNKGFKLKSTLFEEDLDKVIQYTYARANPYYCA